MFTVELSNKSHLCRSQGGVRNSFAGGSLLTCYSLSQVTKVTKDSTLGKFLDPFRVIERQGP